MIEIFFAIALLVFFVFFIISLIAHAVENAKNNISEIAQEINDKKTKRIERKITKTEADLEKMWRKAKDEVDREIDPYDY